MVLIVLFIYFTAAKSQDKTALHLAQCLRAETNTYSGQHDREWAAMSWVLRKRAYQKGVSLNAMVQSYCSVFESRSARYNRLRGKDIRASTFDDPKHGTKKEWQRLKDFVERFMAGIVPDPCWQANHFGNENDVRGKTTLVEVCPWLGKRGNKFYKVKR
jgi:hypothetical protein